MSGENYTLPDLMRDAWTARRFIAGGALVAVVIAALFLLVAVPQYKAQMTVSPANPMNGAEASSLLADDNLFALRYLVQRVGVAHSSDFLRFENKFSGASVARVLLEDPQIQAGLKRDKRFSFMQAEYDWSAGALSAYIAKRIKLEPVGATSLRRIVYRHGDPAFATYFIQRVHAVTDEQIRSQIKDSAAGRIEYLQQTIARTQNQEHRRALTTLLMEQERLRMLVSIETPYAAAVVEAASSGYKPAWPRKSVVLTVFVFVGAFLGFVFSGFQHSGLISRVSNPVSAKRWFRADAANITRRPLTGTQTYAPSEDERKSG